MSDDLVEAIIERVDFLTQTGQMQITSVPILVQAPPPPLSPPRNADPAHLQMGLKAVRGVSASCNLCTGLVS